MVHGADRDMPGGGFDLLILHLEEQPDLTDRRLSARQLRP